MRYDNWKDVKKIMKAFSAGEESTVNLIAPLFAWASHSPVSLNLKYIKKSEHLQNLVSPTDSVPLEFLRFNFVVSGWKEKVQSFKNLVVIECVLQEESNNDGPPFIERESFNVEQLEEINHLASTPLRLFDLSETHKDILFWSEENLMTEEEFRKQTISWLRNPL